MAEPGAHLGHLPMLQNEKATKEETLVAINLRVKESLIDRCARKRLFSSQELLVVKRQRKLSSPAGDEFEFICWLEPVGIDHTRCTFPTPHLQAHDQNQQ